MKKLSLSILCLITASQLLFAEALPASKDPAVQKNADKQIKLQNVKVMEAAIEAYSKNLPQKVDDYTTFTKVHSEGLTLIRTYEINTGAKSDDAVRAEDKSRMNEAVIYGVCTTSKRFLDSNINLTYLYKSAKSKEELFRIEITQKNCFDIWAGLK